MFVKFYHTTRAGVLVEILVLLDLSAGDRAIVERARAIGEAIRSNLLGTDAHKKIIYVFTRGFPLPSTRSISTNVTSGSAALARFLLRPLSALPALLYAA